MQPSLRSALIFFRDIAIFFAVFLVSLYGIHLAHYGNLVLSQYVPMLYDFCFIATIAYFLGMALGERHR
jgi:hypothetical protein